MKYILREEYKPWEHRTILTPQDAKKLVQRGLKIFVESSKLRCFADEEYFAAGCNIVPAESWKEMKDVLVMGLKELPLMDSYTHKHLCFQHIFKQQKGSEEYLAAFKKGGGTLYDLEYLTDKDGNRLAAFGWAAGFVGMFLGLRNWICQLVNVSMTLNPKMYSSQEEIIRELRETLDMLTVLPKILIIGSKGRCGTGANYLIQQLGLEKVVTNWDREETQIPGPYPQILDYDIFLNTIKLEDTYDGPPFLDPELLKVPKRRLSTIVDVSCDVGRKNNVIPIYDDITTIENPVRTLIQKPLLDIIAIDNLPSICPVESSTQFSAILSELLLDFEKQSDVWKTCENYFLERKKLFNPENINISI